MTDHAPQRPAHTPDRQTITRDAVRRAAMHEFTQFGYRRSAMDSIARRAGVSRATVYLHWPSKEALFRDVVSTLHADALDAMIEAEADTTASVEQRWARLLAARFSRFVQLTSGSPVAAELYDAYGRLCDDIGQEYEQRTRDLLTSAVSRAAEAGELDLNRAGVSVPVVTDVLEQLAHGAKIVSAGPDGPSYDDAVHASVRTVLAGIAAWP